MESAFGSTPPPWPLPSPPGLLSSSSCAGSRSTSSESGRPPRARPRRWRWYRWSTWIAKGGAIGGLGGGGLEQPGQRLGCDMGGQWARRFPWACRAALGRQARSEEAHEPSSATAEGPYEPAARQEGLVVRRGDVRLGRHEHARRVHVVALCELHEALDREAAPVERVHHAALEEQHHRHRGDAEAPACQRVAGSATALSAASSRVPEAATGHSADRELPVGVRGASSRQARPTGDAGAGAATTRGKGGEGGTS